MFRFGFDKSGLRKMRADLKQHSRLKRHTTLERLEDRTLFAGVVAGYAVTQDWGSGFQAGIRLTNSQTTDVTSWRLEFDYSANITSIWDAKIVSHTGNHYVVTNAGWNSTLAASSAVSFGFVASPGTSSSTPANYLLNDIPLGGTTPPPPALPDMTISDVSISEGNSGSKTASFNVSLSTAVTSAVVVSYATANGTAQSGSDYTAIAGKLTFAAGQTSKTIQVQILGDTTVEANEAFNLVLSDIVGAKLARSAAIGTIVNDDTPPPTVSDFQFKVSNDWGSGFTGEVTARNSTGSAINGWTMSFDFAGQISSIWNAKIVSHTGSRYVISHADWNANVAAGATVSFGFVGNPSGFSPTNFAWSAVSGNPGSGGDTGGNTGGSTGQNNGTTQRAGLATWPAQYSAPYVDMALYPMYDLATVAKTQGVKFFTLAFITADSQSRPAWGGFAEYVVGNSEWDTKMKSQIDGVREAGGDVMVSFGGASNRELAEVITDVSALKAAYQKVIDAYQLTHIDFDIEGAAQRDFASVDRRSQAIAALQRDAAAAGRTLDVWYTLPVLPTGLTADGLYSIQSALRFGVDIAGVNIMAMDYGDSAAPNPAGRMGDYAIQAGTSLFNQLKSLYRSAKTDDQLWKMVGITPMIGMNDVQTEIFDQQEARELVAWANQRGIGRLSNWSLNRDKQNPNGSINYVELTSSSVSQTPFEFALIFQQIEN